MPDATDKTMRELVGDYGADRGAGCESAARTSESAILARHAEALELLRAFQGGKRPVAATLRKLDDYIERERTEA